MSRLIARHLRFVPTAKSDTLEFEARDFRPSFSFSLLFFSFSRITPELRKSHASQWNNPERLRPELRGLIGFRPDFSGFRGPTNILILKFVEFQDKLIPNYISDSNFFPISVLRCAQFIIKICNNPEHRTLNKSIYPINPPFQNLSLRIAFLRMNMFTINKFSIEKKSRGFNCLRNTEKQDQSAFPRNSGGIGGKRKWRWRVDNVAFENRGTIDDIC